MSAQDAPHVHLIHGIRAWDPQTTMGGLRTALIQRHCTVHMLDYGYIIVPMWPNTNAWARRELRRAVRPGDVVVGYSNGAYAIWQEARAGGIRPRHVVLISPALKRDAPWPDFIETVTVFYSPDDYAVWAGTAYAYLISLAPWRWFTPHGFGAMGVLGPALDDCRVHGAPMPDKVCHTWFEYPDVVDSIAQFTSTLVVQP